MDGLKAVPFNRNEFFRSLLKSAFVPGPPRRIWYHA
jgi:hypothetical protein